MFSSPAPFFHKSGDCSHGYLMDSGYLSNWMKLTVGSCPIMYLHANYDAHFAQRWPGLSLCFSASPVQMKFRRISCIRSSVLVNHALTTLSRDEHATVTQLWSYTLSVGAQRTGHFPPSFLVTKKNQQKIKNLPLHQMSFNQASD